MTSARIERARTEDLAPVLRLLESNRLPLDGLAEHLAHTIVARDGESIVGSAALEVYPDGALLRSVAVAEDRRRGGLGRQLTVAALDLAATIASPAVYLLTTTAADYFPRFGFEPIDREDVPQSVKTSVEFRSACPASAIVMRKRLRPAS